MRTTKMNTLCAIGLLTLTSLGVNAQTNLLLNGGFEDGLGPDNIPVSWFNFEGQSITNLSLVTTSPYEGLNALSLSFDPGTNLGGSVQQVVNVEQAGTIYEVSYWYKYTSIAVGNVGGSSLQWVDADGMDVPPVDDDAGFFLGQEAPPTVANVFLPLSVKVTVPPTANRLFLNILTTGGTRGFIVDDARIVKQTTLGGIADDAVSKDLNIYTEGNTAYVVTKGGEKVGVFNLLGQKLMDVKGEPTVTVLSNLAKNQVLIVKVDNKSAKIVLN
jgi:hypothetical protein